MFYTPPTDRTPGEGGVPVPRVTTADLRAALRSDRCLACAGVVLAVGAAILVALVQHDRQEYAGAVLYAPLPPAETGRQLLPATDHRSLPSIVKSPENLRVVVDRLALPISPEDLAERLEVKAPLGSQVLQVSLRWPDASGAQVLNGVQEAFLDGMKARWQAKVEERTAAFAGALARCEDQLREARAAAARFNEEHGVSDLAQEQRMAAADLEALAAAHALARRNAANVRAQMTLVERTIEQKSREAAAVPAKASRSTERLHHLINDDRRQRECEAQLQIKRREYQRTLVLVSQRAATQAELDHLKGEILALEAQIRDSEQIQQWKQELDALDHGAGNQGQQAQAKKLELEMQLFGHRQECELAAGEETAARARLDRLARLQAEATPLAQRVQQLESERQWLQEHLAQVRLLRGSAGGEAAVLQSATLVPRMLGPARRWLIALAAGLACLVLLGGFLLVRLGRRRASSHEHLVAGVGLPVLARMPGALHGPAAATEVQSFALALRQRVPRPGATILFTSVRGGPRVRDLLAQTAASLAGRDERVLILHAVRRPEDAQSAGSKVLVGCREAAAPAVLDEGPALGLSDYLAFEAEVAGEVIHPTPVFGVDLLPAGLAPVSPERLGTHRLRELIEELRETYTILLVEGPVITPTSPLQTLAPCNDGVVLVLDAPDPVRAGDAGALQAHLQLGVPFLGCVTLPA